VNFKHQDIFSSFFGQKVRGGVGWEGLGKQIKNETAVLNRV